MLLTSSYFVTGYTCYSFLKTIISYTYILNLFLVENCNIVTFSLYLNDKYRVKGVTVFKKSVTICNKCNTPNPSFLNSSVSHISFSGISEKISDNDAVQIHKVVFLRDLSPFDLHV